MKCDICAKTPQYGHNVSHSKRHTNRQWKPNIHPVSVIQDGKRVKLNLCTRCMRTLNKAEKASQA